MSVGPTANINYTIEPNDVSFQGTSSLDAFGSPNYFWTFGDGTNFTGPTVNHTYAVDGTYAVHLSVAIGSGHASADASVQVPPSAPTLTSVTDDVAPHTGALSSGDSTNDNDLTVKVTLPSGSGVTQASTGDVVQLTDAFSSMVFNTYTLTDTDITNGYATVQTGFMFDGFYEIVAEIVNGGTAVSGASNPFDVSVDTSVSPPLLGFGPGVSDTNGATASEAEFPGAVTVSGTEPFTTINLTFTNGVHVISKSVSNPLPNQAVQLSASDLATLTDGTIQVSATQTDAAGNTSSAATIGFVLDTVAPTTPVLAYGTGVQFGGATMAEATQASGVVTVTGEAGSTITVNFNGGVVTKTLTGTGSPQAVVLQPFDVFTLGDGPVSVGAIATDPAGNMSTPASPLLFPIDTQPPLPLLLNVDPQYRLVDSSEVFHVTFQVSTIEPGGSATATFTDNLGNHRDVPLLGGQTDGQVDLTGFGHHVTWSTVVYDSAGNSASWSSSPDYIIVDTDSALVLTIADYNSISPVQWQFNPAYSSVTVRDTPANFAALPGSAIAGMAAAGVDTIASSSGSLALTVLQYENLNVMTVAAPANILDTAAHIEALASFAGMFANNIKILQYSDTPLVLTPDQYNSLGGVLLPTNHSTTLQVSQADIAGFTTGFLGGLYAGGISGLVATAGVSLSAAQAAALGKVTVSAPSVTLADTAANITGLSTKQLTALAGSGFTTVDASDTVLNLTVSQFRAIGAVALAAGDTVTLKDSWANISTLDLSTLGAKNVDYIYVTNGSFGITAAQYSQLLAGGADLTGPAVATLTGQGSDIAALDLSGLAANGISKIDASDNLLSLTLDQYTSLNGVQLTAGDTVTLKDTSTIIGNLASGQIGGLAAGRIDQIDVSSPGAALSWGLDQFNALGTVVLKSDVALSLDGAGGNDTFSFSRQTLSAADKIDGEGGTDTLALTGNYGNLVFNADTIANVEKLKVYGGGHGYSITENNGNIAANQTLVVAAVNFGAGDSFSFDGSAETDGSFSFTGGGAGSTSTFTGGNKADIFTAGAGADTIRYSSAAQSTSAAYDTVNGFDTSSDSFFWNQSITFDGTVNAVLRSNTLDDNLASAFGSIAANHAAIVQASGGNLSGQMFLLINDGTAGYQTGDLVVRLAGTDPATFSSANFTHS